MSGSSERHPLWIYPVGLGGCALAAIVAVVIARSQPAFRLSDLEPPEPTALTTAVEALPQGVTVALMSGSITVERTLPSLGFTLGPGDSLDERIPAGAFTAAFTVSFDPGAVRQARIGAHLQGGQLTVRHAPRDDAPGAIIHTDAAGAEPRLALSSPVRPVNLGTGVQTFVYEFVRTDPEQTAVLRAVWQPVEARAPEPLPSVGAPLLADAARRGEVVFQTHGCASCHASGDATMQARLDAVTAPDLRAVGSRVRPSWLRRWLLDPSAIKAHAAMPSLAPAAGAGAWAEDLTHFLVDRGGPLAAESAAPSDSLVATGRIAYHQVGCFACHGALEPVDALPGERTASRARSWTRYVTLPDLAAKTTADALATYLADPLGAHPGGLMPSQHLSELEARAIAAYLITRSGTPAPEPAFTPEARRVERGRAIFRREGCAQCHAVPSSPLKNSDGPTSARFRPDRTVDSRRIGRDMPSNRRSEQDETSLDLGRAGVLQRAASAAPVDASGAASLESIAQTPNDGCLAGAPGAGVPVYAFSSAQRSDLGAFLERQRERRCASTPWDELGVSVTRLRCTACHAFHADAGPEAAIRPYFETVGEADLGDEGRLPPPLTDAGARLTTMWMREVLGGLDDDGEPVQARPYIAARMGHFGTRATDRLPDLLASVAGANALLDEEPTFSIEAAQAGRTVVGASGLNCIQCHEIAGRASTGTPGPDLALMPARLRYEHFARWLIDPARMTPGTRMPTFFVHNRSPLEDLLDGDGDAQIAAMWSYLSQGEQLALPEGLTDPAGLELVVTDEPIVFRTFMKQAGVRAIACGFPEQVHCAFDADRCVVSAAWQGQFLSAAGAWAARGGSETNPAELRWTAPDGPLLTIRGADGEPTQRFRGYRLDAERRPVFLYDVTHGPTTVRVQERPRPTTNGTLERFLSFEGPVGTQVAVNDEGLEMLGTTPVELDAAGRGNVTLEVSW